MSRLKLKSFDGEIFEVDIQVANHSCLIKDMLENMKGIDDGNDDPILLPNCHSLVLSKVLEYCTFHKDDVLIPNDETTLQRSDYRYHWDQEFINKVLFYFKVDIRIFSSLFCISYDKSLNFSIV